MEEAAQYKLKNDLEQVILESFDKAKQKKFKELNFSFTSKGQEEKFLKTKIEVLKKLDVYSKTFLSIHTRAKVALREFMDKGFKYEGASNELLRLVLTLHNNIGQKKSVAIKEKVPHEWDDLVVGEDLVKKYSPKYSTENNIAIVTQEPVNKKIKFIKEEVTGQQLNKTKKKVRRLTDLCLDIEF